MIHFLKNLSVMGGLLYVAAYGAGALSMDAGLERTDRRPRATSDRETGGQSITDRSALAPSS